MPEEFKKRQVAHKFSIGMILNGSPKIVGERFQFHEIFGNQVYRVNLIANVTDKYVSNQKPYSNIKLDDGTGEIRAKAFADNAQTLMPFEIGDTVKIIGLIRFYNNEVYVVPEIVLRVDPKWLLVRKMELTKEFGKKYDENIVTERYNDGSIEGGGNEQIPEGDNIPSNVKSFEQIIEQKIKPTALQGNLFGKPEEIQANTEEKVEEEKIIETKVENNTQKSLKDQIMEKLKEHDLDGGIDLDKLIMGLTAPVDEINKLIVEFLEEGIAYEPRPGRIQLL